MTVPARGSVSLSADALLGRFHDVAYAYRFGAPGHDLVVATLHDASGVRIADAFHFPLGLPSARRDDGRADRGRRATRRWVGRASTCERSEFAQSVAVDGGDAVPDDNYFHVAPGDARVVRVSSSVERARVGDLRATAQRARRCACFCSTSRECARMTSVLVQIGRLRAASRRSIRVDATRGQAPHVFRARPPTVRLVSPGVDSARRDCGVVICNPLGYEELCAHRAAPPLGRGTRVTPAFRRCGSTTMGPGTPRAVTRMPNAWRRGSRASRTRSRRFARGVVSGTSCSLGMRLGGTLAMAVAERAQVDSAHPVCGAADRADVRPRGASR